MEADQIAFSLNAYPLESVSIMNKQEKENLRMLILDRISEINKSKASLINRKMTLTSQIEKLLESSLQRIDSYIACWNSLLIKEDFTNDDILKTNKIKTLKLVALPMNEFINIDEIIEFFNQKPFKYKAIYKDDFRDNFLEFKKANYGKFSKILKSQDNSFYVTGGIDGIIRTWDINGNLKDNYYYDQKEITSLALSDDRQYLASGSLDGSVNIIILKFPNNPVGVYQHRCKSNLRLKEKVSSVSISDKSKFVISGTDKEIVILGLEYKIYKKLDVYGFYCSIRQVGNKEFIIGTKFNLISIFNCNFSSPFKNFPGIEFYKSFSLIHSKSGKYAVCRVVMDEENSERCKINVLKLNIPVVGVPENKEKEAIGVDINKIFGYKKLKYDERQVSKKFLFLRILNTLLLVIKKMLTYGAQEKKEFLIQLL